MKECCKASIEKAKFLRKEHVNCSCGQGWSLKWVASNLLALLEDLERSGGESGWCPICTMLSNEDHQPECLLGRILELLR